MLTYLSELLFAVTMLLGLALAGGFVVLPFGKRMPFVMLAAPLAGLLCLMLCVAATYSIAAWPLTRCIWVSATLCFIATLISTFVNGVAVWKRNWVWLLIAFVLIVPLSTWANNATSIFFHGPGILYLDGTDHLGYAHIADWLRAHTVIGRPERGSPDPYEWFPALIFRTDPRFGSFFFLATVSTIRGLTGTFSYDCATGIALAAGILAVAGVFARSRLSLFLLIAGLVVCHWYDYGRGGYFGKLLGYPAALMLIGLFFNLPERPSSMLICLMGILMGGAALVHSGLATLLFFATAILPYLATRFIVERRRPDRPRELLWNSSGIAILLLGIALLTTGILSRPVHTDFPDWRLKWGYILPRALDLENQGVVFSGLKPAELQMLEWGAFTVWAVLIGVAILRRDPPAVGLLAGPLLLIGVLAATNGGAQVFQLIGMLYPMSLCGSVWLIDDAKERTPSAGIPWLTVFWKTAVILMIVGMIGLRALRYRGALDHYAGRHVNPRQQFSKELTDRLAETIGDRVTDVDIDTREPNQAIFALTELSQHAGIRLHWTPRAWNAIVGFTGELPPKYDRPAPLRLVVYWDPSVADGRLLFSTPQYRLLDMTP
jgi:hypothetical protein